MDAIKRKLILDQLDLLGVDYANYTLPDMDNPNVLHIIPISGGSDSKCMALILSAIFPQVRFVFAFTDTKAEEDASYQEFDQISEWVGHSVIQIAPEKGLFDLIDSYNGFLPSGQARYCTRILKLKSLDNWLESKFKGLVDKVNLYIGIRADEDRFTTLSEDGRNENWVTPKYPYMALDMGRSQVYGLLAATAGISPVYKHSSRSGCGCCFFKRASERVMQCCEAHNEFTKAGRYEKLSNNDLDKLANSKLYSAISTVNPRYFDRMIHNPDILLAKPVSLLTESEANPLKPLKANKRTELHNLDLFDTSVNYVSDKYDTAYVAVMFLVHPDANNIGLGGSLTGTNGVYFHKIVNYTTTLHGLTRTLNYVYEQILSTAELYGETQQSLMRNLRIGTYEIKVPKGNLILDKVDNDSYTWAGNGLSYQSIKQNITQLHWILFRSEQERLLNEYKSVLENKLAKAKLFDDAEDRMIERHFVLNSVHYERYKQQKQFMQHMISNEILNIGVITWSGMYNNIALDQLPSVLAKARKIDKANGNNEGQMACMACSL
ncbi:TPA: hypothetical protein ACX6RO_001840 [Photobacterium damselae]